LHVDACSQRWDRFVVGFAPAELLFVCPIDQL
jgi:hypothetical protein